MTAPHVVRAAERPTTRWANGLGATVELLRVPGTGDLTMRLSLATIDSDAPFSALPGIDRVLMPLSDDGLTLEVDGVRRTLARHESIAFPGEASVRALDVRQPGRDLNLMVRRGTGSPSLTTVDVVGATTIDPGSLAVVVLTPGVSAASGTLSVGDTVLGGSGPIALSGDGVVAVARRGPAGG